MRKSPHGANLACACKLTLGERIPLKCLFSFMFHSLGKEEIKGFNGKEIMFKVLELYLKIMEGKASFVMKFCLEFDGRQSLL